MHFHVDIDNGESIIGWVIPDNPTETPKIIVRLPGQEPLQVEASLYRQDIVDLGRHNTGMVGFKIDKSHVSNLPQETEIELRDFSSGILIYKRFNIDKHLDKRFVFLDQGIMPQRKVFNFINSFFSLPFNFCERIPFESLLGIIYGHSKSVLLTGRPHYMRHMIGLRDKQFIVTALLRDPFEELAERLIFLNMIAKSKASNLLMTFATGLLPLIEFAREFPFDNDRAMATFLRQTSLEHRQLLRDPLTRMLACNVDEKAGRQHVTLALDNLAAMDAVGTRSRFNEFRATVAGIMEKDIFGDNAPETPQIVLELAPRLAKIGFVQDFLEHDLALYSYVEEAVETGLDEARRKAS